MRSMSARIAASSASRLLQPTVRTCKVPKFGAVCAPVIRFLSQPGRHHPPGFLRLFRVGHGRGCAVLGRFFVSDLPARCSPKSGLDGRGRLYTCLHATANPRG